jgi:hypothetical protein
MTVQACKVSKDVYVEKPVCLAVEEGRKIVRRGELAKVTFVRTWNYGNQPAEGIGNPPDSDPPPVWIETCGWVRRWQALVHRQSRDTDTLGGLRLPQLRRACENRNANVQSMFNKDAGILFYGSQATMFVEPWRLPSDPREKRPPPRCEVHVQRQCEPLGPLFWSASAPGSGL